ncbi:hypothetical protein DMH17_17045 [Raoultella planticola]|nr:hypothetical protein [Raoultella planticola]
MLLFFIMASFAIECPTMSKKYDSFLSMCCEQNDGERVPILCAKRGRAGDIQGKKSSLIWNKTGERLALNTLRLWRVPRR